MTANNDHVDNTVSITRQGDGAHRAGHVWELRIGGRYHGVYETKRQARDAAADVEAATR